MGQEFIGSDKPSTWVDDVLADSADHSVEVDHAHYGAIRGAIPRVSHSQMRQHRWIGEQWSSLCGLGPRPPPKPCKSRMLANGEPTLSLEDGFERLEGKLFTVIEDKLQVLATTIADRLHASLISSLPILGCQAQVTCSPTKFTQKAPSVFDADDTMRSTTGANETMPISPALKSIRGDDSHVPSDRGISGHKGVPPAAPNGVGMQGPNSNTISEDRPHLKRPSDASFDTEGRKGKRSRLKGGDVQISWANVTGKLNNNNESPSAITSTRPSSPPKSFLEGDWEVYNELLPDSSHFPTSMPYTPEDVRSGLARLLKQTSAKETSPHQLEALLHVLNKKADTVVVLRTGAGKSMLWMVPALLVTDWKAIVVCPFSVLLDDQFQKTVQAGIKCHKYCTQEEVPGDSKLVFVQVEHINSWQFKE